MHGLGIKSSQDASGNTILQAGRFANDTFLEDSTESDARAAQQAAQKAMTAAGLASALRVGDSPGVLKSFRPPQ